VSLEFSARCPKCDNRAFERPEPLDVALEFECHACGHRGRLVEFLDLATLDAVAEDLKRRARETLKSTIGAKALG
jgi:hypothetical protein